MIYTELIKFGVNVAAIAIQYKQLMRANHAILCILIEYSKLDKAYLIYYLSRDTSITPYTRLPVSTVLTSMLTTQLIKTHDGNLQQFTVLYYIPPHSAKICQDYDPKPIPPYVYVNQATKLTIYTPFLLFPYLLSLRNVLTLLHSLCTQLNNIYFTTYYYHLYSLRDI